MYEKLVTVSKQINVVGAVIVRDGLILCAQRGPGGNLAGMWEFPGGKIEPGESPRDALVREIDEELRCEVVVGDEVTTTTSMPTTSAPSRSRPSSASSSMGRRP